MKVSPRSILVEIVLSCLSGISNSQTIYCNENGIILFIIAIDMDLIILTLNGINQK